MRPPSRPIPKWTRDLLLLTAAALSIIGGFREYRGIYNFGFTAQYLAIANSTAALHRYSERLLPPAPLASTTPVASTVPVASTAPFASPAKSSPPAQGKLITEVQREPLYPAALIFIRHVLHVKYDYLHDFQLLAMIAALGLWGRLALREFGRCATISLYVLTLLCPIPAFYTWMLYPYSFQFFLVTLGAYLLVDAVRGGGIWTWIGAGVALGIAPYERGAYLALPIFMAVALLVVRKRFRSVSPVQSEEGAGDGAINECRNLPSGPSLLSSPVSTAERRQARISLFRIGLFLLVALALPFPWLLRNRNLGATGMNQMTGYSLGYAFGDLRGHPHDDFERGYDASVFSSDTDNGTIRYIQENVLAGNGSLAEVDRRVGRYVLRKCLNHPGEVLRLIGSNMIGFPYRLCDPSLGYLRTPDHIAAHFWQRYANALPVSHVRKQAKKQRWPGAPDLVVMVLALLGMAVMVRDNLVVGIVLGALLLYTFLFSTTIVRFDPRYRGAADPVLFIAAGVAISRMGSWAWRSVSTALGRGQAP